jgi:hypothetical protein
LAADAREVIQRHLNSGSLACGPAVLAARVRGVAAAQTAGDMDGLRGSLIELAAAALSWADRIDTGVVHERAAA